MRINKNLRSLMFVVFAVGICLLGAMPAQGQWDRTWVSQDGDDAQPCTHQNPCKTFAGAIAKTNSSGEIVAMNSGGYGPVKITKSITIDGAGAYAGTNNSLNVDGTTTAAIWIDAASNSIVVIRGLTLKGPTSTQSIGIYVAKAGVLIVEGCAISGYGTGIYPVAAQVFVKDTTFRSNGLALEGTSGGGTLEHCRFEKNDYGIDISGDASALPLMFSNCLLSGSSQIALKVAGAQKVTIERSVITGCGHAVSCYFGAVAYVSETMIANNSVGLDGPGQIISFGNNRLANNTTDGAFTSIKSQQ